MNFKRTKVVAVTAALSAALITSGVPLAAYATPDDLQQRVNEAYATLMSYTMDLELAASELYSVREELAAVEAEIAATQEEIAAKKETIAQGQASISDRLSATYKNGNANLMSVVLGASDFSELFSRIFYANKVADADAKVIEQVRSDMAELEKKETELAQQKAEQEKLVTEQEAKTEQVNSRVSQQQAFYDGLDSELQAQLANEEALRLAQEAAEKAAQEESKNNNSNAGSGSNTSNGSGNQGNGGNSGNSGNGGNGNNNGNSGNTTPEQPTTPTTPTTPEKPTTPTTPSKPSDNGNTNNGNAPSSVVDIARSKVGSPYVFGTAGPDTFDCSGLVTWSYKQLGISITHWSQGQFNLVKSKGHLVYDIDKLSPGDLVFWGTGGNTSKIYHVGIYIGGGRYVHASAPGIGVVESTLRLSTNYVGGGSPV